ncbi:hypothetical protein [Actinomyces succiniciruminis]|uniref:Uncharacterized protein n=1 Tax=Actinomyces succiniciruminis TaxID=1522002 RepID=A0A1L7RL18_9ACTO|nr:hypothetical protein [Actinomyces succiniciruminis]CED90840.1 Hypothetical protein AAM4_1008 [Actinomyces succiniciruminis]
MTYPWQGTQDGFERGAAPYGGSQRSASSRLQVSGSLVRRPGAASLVAGVVFLFGGLIVFSIVQTLHAADPESPVTVPLCAGGVILLFLGVAVLRRRTLFDAHGIHSRGLLRTVHLSWPDSRAGFIVVTDAGGKHAPVPVVEVETAGKRTRLSAPRLSSRTRLEAEVDAIWSWALARGYARETMPALFSPQGVGPRNVQNEYPAVPVLRTPPADQTLLAHEPLILKDKPNWHGLIPNIVILVFLCILALPAVLGPERTPQAFAGVFREDGTLRLSSGFWILLVASAGGLVVSVHRIVREHTILSREGLALVVWRTLRVAWPPSSSYFFVRSRRYFGHVEASAWLLDPAGLALRVPGTACFSKHEDQALLAAAAAAQTIWEWGVSRAVAYDDGTYYSVPDDAIEQERRANDRRIAYLMSRDIM